MRAWKWLVGTAAVAAAAVALREVASRRGGIRAMVTLSPGESEPVLGYDGMDRDTLIDWLGEADLDRETLLLVRDYEVAHRSREGVLEAVDALLD